MTRTEFELNIYIHAPAADVFSIAETLRRCSNGINTLTVTGLQVDIDDRTLTVIPGSTHELRKALSERYKEVLFSAKGYCRGRDPLVAAGIILKAAEAAPGASFSGSLRGSAHHDDSFDQIEITFSLRQGTLHFETFTTPTGDGMDAYVKYFTEALPRKRFTELFGLDPAEFDDDAYGLFVYRRLADTEISLNDFDYDLFRRKVGCRVSVSADQFEDALTELDRAGIKDFTAYLADSGLAQTAKYDYDPTAKKYL